MNYANYDSIVLFTAKQLGVRLDKDDIHDVKVELWESEERFLDAHNAQDRPLTDAEALHLRNQLFFRARGAIIDLIRFKTWAKKLSTGLAKPTLVSEPKERGTSSPEDQWINKIFLDSMPEGNMVKEYLLGSTMKEIGAKRGLTEARISQVFKEML